MVKMDVPLEADKPRGKTEMQDPTWEAKIYLKTSYSPLTVQITAPFKYQAKKAIEAMYGNNIKSWGMGPYMIINEQGKKFNTGVKYDRNIRTKAATGKTAVIRRFGRTQLKNKAI